jgi:uncharacterized protein DUF6310
MAMRFLTCIALLLLLSACATTEPGPKEPEARTPRRANLQRAAALPWTDEGRCVVQEASQPWSVVVERCFHALDTRRILFRDIERRCPVASTDAATVETMVGICLLAQPELVVGAVVVIGVVVVAVVIKEELDAYELKGVHPEEVRPVPETKPIPLEPLAKRRPKPEPKGPDFPPIGPVEVTERDRPRCEPDPVPYHLGGNKLHDTCADRIPNNSFPGGDVFVNGKNFDALQLATRTLWEVKTDNFDTYTDELQGIVVTSQVPKLRLERELARACGFDFRVGVLSAAHKAALELAAPDLDGLIVVMEWC